MYLITKNGINVDQYYTPEEATQAMLDRYSGDGSWSSAKELGYNIESLREFERKKEFESLERLASPLAYGNSQEKKLYELISELSG